MTGDTEALTLPRFNPSRLFHDSGDEVDRQEEWVTFESMQKFALCAAFGAEVSNSMFQGNREHTSDAGRYSEISAASES